MKNILITGCGSGLGRSAAISLASRGHFVYATTHTTEQSVHLNKLNEKWCLPLFSFKLDIRDEKDRLQVQDLDLDILINNAAIGDSGSVCEIDVNKYRNVFETNVFSSIELTQLALKKMILKGTGRIIFLSSLSGRKAIPFLSPYCATKFALEAIASSLNMELKLLKNTKIPVIIIEPGSYSTGFNEKNISKQFDWMNERSYYRNQIRKLQRIQYGFFKVTSTSNISSIIQEYIKAVEDKKPKERYIAPFFQGAFIRIINTYNK